MTFLFKMTSHIDTSDIRESETFIVTFDLDEYESDDEYSEDTEHTDCDTDLDQLLSTFTKLQIEDDEKEQYEIAQWKKIQEEAMDYYDMSKFENYVRWYVSMMQGTLEQPYLLHDDNGDILTARNYFKAKENQMVEMRLLFDDSQLERVKQFLIQIGFVFENLNFMFESQTLGTSHTLGSVKNPFYLLSTNEGEENDMLYAYNDYNANNRRVSEMRLVFSFDQTDTIKKYLKLGGFFVL